MCVHVHTCYKFSVHNLVLWLNLTDNSNTYHKVKTDLDQLYGSQVVSEIMKKPGKNLVTSYNLTVYGTARFKFDTRVHHTRVYNRVTP